MPVYLYTAIFPVEMGSLTESSPINIWIAPGEVREIPDVRYAYPGLNGPQYLRISADAVADQILKRYGQLGLIRIQGPKPTRAEIEQSERLAQSYAISALREYSALSKHAEKSGLPAPMPPQNVVKGAKYLIQRGVNVSYFNLPESLLEVVAGMESLLPPDKQRKFYWEEETAPPVAADEGEIVRVEVDDEELTPPPPPKRGRPKGASVGLAEDNPFAQLR